MSTQDNRITVTAVDGDGQPAEFVVGDRTIPVVVGWGPDGSLITLRDLGLRQLRDSVACDHKGVTWSSELAMQCPHCGAEMFLPPRLLAYLPASSITAMHALWAAAGWPAWRWDNTGWRTNERWAIMEQPLFAHCGGIAVRHDRRELFLQTLADLGV